MAGHIVLVPTNHPILVSVSANQWILISGGDIVMGSSCIRHFALVDKKKKTLNMCIIDKSVELIRYMKKGREGTRVTRRWFHHASYTTC